MSMTNSESKGVARGRWRGVALVLGALTLGIAGAALAAVSQSDQLSPEGEAIKAAKESVVAWEDEYRKEAEERPLPDDTSRPEFVPDEWPQGIFGKDQADLGWAQFENVWGGTVEGMFVAAYAGSDPSDASVGAVYVQVIDPKTMETVSEDLYPSPLPGPIKITSEKSGELTVVSLDSGGQASFDLESGRFTT
jgi:hypothetical protein